ncbi:HlyD family secretion protein [Flavihumibacter profundi]|uniref:HlyD family secretion protein n=1 Tax=Flavihumibacter profundi TaxID=2716883 RepID=UPI001CC4AAAF|nr:HlyD family secretion protein [Flavihumibacter profundi]MBZ5856767.1 HlyD family secretion protein [Flavihumibacter profundi]
MEPKANQPIPVEGKKKLNLRFIVVFAILVLGGSAFGITKYIHGQHHEDTDDAQVEADISPVIPRVGGYITEVRVKDNQLVKKGDTLLILDDRDFKLKLEQAEAAIAAAKNSLGAAEANTSASEANIATTKANVATIDAQIETAKVNLWRTEQDFKRYENLFADHSITQQQYEQASAAKQTAEKQLKVLDEQRKVAIRQTNATASQSKATAKQINVSNANILQRIAERDAAALNLTYTVVTAGADGRVSKVNVHPGQFIQAGQACFSLVQSNSIWVVANFKETQLNKMAEGQKAIITADAFPGQKFAGKISSFSPATGSRFSLLPPDNSSGNFVKVVQRLPVKIDFTEVNEKLENLRPGMNVSVDVHLDKAE